MRIGGQLQVNENNEIASALNADSVSIAADAISRASVHSIPVKSEESKRGRGGKRQGAGRKPNLAKRLLKGFTRDSIAQAAADIDVREVIVGLLKARSERTRLETLAFLRDTLYGRPAQSVSLSGAVVHAHGLWRPLESLTDEEILLLDSITKKLNSPAVSDASPDGPQFQKDSIPATNAIDVECEDVQAAQVPRNASNSETSKTATRHALD